MVPAAPSSILTSKSFCNLLHADARQSIRGLNCKWARGCHHVSVEGQQRPLIVATYNVHRCIGGDGRQDIERVAAVICELEADIVGLQEVGSAPSVRIPDQVERLAALAGFHGLAAPLYRRPDSAYGNALLTRVRPGQVRLVDLSEDRREPRGAIVADVLVPDGPIRTVVTHLGLRAYERRSQLERLVDSLPDGTEPTLLLADLNEWSNRASRLRLTHQFAGDAVRSFPASWPILPLDRILVRPRSWLLRVTPHRSELARVASDHLPVRAELRSPG